MTKINSMKKYLLILFWFAISKSAESQILCIQCFDQNDSISSGVHNLLQNGSFEKIYHLPSNGYSFCPRSKNYGFDFPNWICTGGGTDTYAHLADTSYGVYPLNG